jgi:hypothetical protein
VLGCKHPLSLWSCSHPNPNYHFMCEGQVSGQSYRESNQWNKINSEFSYSTKISWQCLHWRYM